MNKGANQLKPEASWTVLLVDGHGRIRKIPRFRQKMIALGFGVLTVFVLGTVAISLYARTRHNLSAMATALQERETQIDGLQTQNELLLARVVKAESRREAAAADAPPASEKAASLPVTTAEKPPAAAAKPPLPRTASPAAAPSPSAEPPKSQAAAENAQGREAPMEVAVDRFEADYHEEQQALVTRFVIRNTGETHAEGRTVVVMRAGDGLDLTLPPVPMRDDSPLGSRGRRFSIARFMTMELERQVAEPGMHFDSAEVFVFDNQGALLMQKTFDVAVSVPARRAPKPKADAAPPLAPLPASNSILPIPVQPTQEKQSGQEE
jgi:hypothetical protein